jgi:hypothetical protein
VLSSKDESSITLIAKDQGATQTTGIQTTEQKIVSTPAVEEPGRVNATSAVKSMAAVFEGWTITVNAVNSRLHLQGLKRTGGGVGSARHDDKQQGIETFFKKRKFGYQDSTSRCSAHSICELASPGSPASSFSIREIVSTGKDKIQRSVVYQPPSSMLNLNDDRIHTDLFRKSMRTELNLYQLLSDLSCHIESFKGIYCSRLLLIFPINRISLTQSNRLSDHRDESKVLKMSDN